MNREQDSFDWFTSLLKEVEDQKVPDEHGNLYRVIDMHMYMTTAKKKTDIKGIGLQMALDIVYEKKGRDLLTGLQARTNPGRPDWDKVGVASYGMT